MVQVFWPEALYAVSDTVYVPTALYGWVGFCMVAVPPSPKFHDQAVGEFVDRSQK